MTRGSGRETPFWLELSSFETSLLLGPYTAAQPSNRKELLSVSRLLRLPSWEQFLRSSLRGCATGPREGTAVPEEFLTRLRRRTTGRNCSSLGGAARVGTLARPSRCFGFHSAFEKSTPTPFALLAGFRTSPRSWGPLPLLHGKGIQVFGQEPAPHRIQHPTMEAIHAEREPRRDGELRQR